MFFLLPLCQLERANVLVGAFTKNLPVRYRSMFDLAANLLFLVLAARSPCSSGTARRKSSATTTRPWCCASRRAGRTPRRWRSVWLLVMVTAYTVARSVLEIGTDRAIGPPPSGEH